MRPLKYIFIAGLLSASLFSSCKKEDKYDHPLAPSAVAPPLENEAWKMDLFMENGRDQSQLFKKYFFRFLSTNTVTATDGSGGYAGRWTTVYGDQETTLTIVFGQRPFDELNDAWIVIRMDSKAMRLKHKRQDGGGDGWDYLTFVKL